MAESSGGVSVTTAVESVLICNMSDLLTSTVEMLIRMITTSRWIYSIYNLLSVNTVPPTDRICR